MKCIYCGKESGENYFCIGGGTTLDRSNTGEGFQTKSFCYSDFLIGFKLNKVMGVTNTEADKKYALWADLIKEWYKSIPYVQDEAKAEVEV